MSNDNVIPFPKRNEEVEKVLMTTDDLQVILAKVMEHKEQIEKQKQEIQKQRELIDEQKKYILESILNDKR